MDYILKRLPELGKKRYCFYGVGILLSIMFLMSYRAELHESTVASACSVGMENREKVFSAILIEKNDTLWEIATEYYSYEYEDLNDYIEEIKRTNGMKDDSITEGQYLIIPYFESMVQ